MRKDFVIFQPPNKYLWTMIITWLLGFVTTGILYSLTRTTFLIAGIVWSYEEIVHGANWFRKILGVAVLASIFVTLFNLIKN